MWMQKNGPTDVLSFPIFSNESLNNFDHIELGDIFISLEMALKQSHEYKHSIYREMLWLASHGFLHLLGWEHNCDNELDKMLDFQEYLISRLA
jgi:probable rRNA maturation factor